MVNRQREMEVRFLKLQGQPQQRMEEVYGPMEDWILRLGTHELLLMPPVGEWAILDRRHQSWEHTGLGTGEVDFSEVDGRLTIQRRPGAGPYRKDLGEDRWYVRTRAGTFGPQSRAEILREMQAGRLQAAAVRRVDTPVWLRAEGLDQPAEDLGVATLQVMVGVDTGRQILLGEHVILGSGPGSTVRLEDAHTMQAEIVHRGRSIWKIRDLGGGTCRNGELVEGWETLRPGDVIGVGTTRLLFHQLQATP